MELKFIKKYPVDPPGRIYFGYYEIVYDFEIFYDEDSENIEVFEKEFILNCKCQI